MDLMPPPSTALSVLEVGLIQATLDLNFQNDHLSLVSLNEWTMVVRTDFDLFYEDEPFNVVSLLLHSRSGQYLTRVWNKTIAQGVIKDDQDLDIVIRNTFR